MAYVPYADHTDIGEVLRSQIAVDLSADSGGTVDDTLLDAVLVEASHFIDTYVGARYALPLTEASNPDAWAILRTHALIIGRQFLYRRAGVQPRDESSAAAHKESLTWLKDLVARRAMLPGVSDAVVASSASTGGFAGSDRRVFADPLGGCDEGWIGGCDVNLLLHDRAWNAKGDLAVGQADDTAAILPVGTNGYVLTADSTQTLGVKWAPGGGGGGGDAYTTNPLSQFAATTSSQLAGVISDETGSGLLVFGTNPVLTTPFIGDFTNAQHSHANAAGGGTLDAAAIASGTFDLTGSRFGNSGTSTTLLHGNASGTFTWAKVSLVNDVTGTLAIANGGTGATDAAGARTALGLAIGTDVQAYDADLSAFAALAATPGILAKTAANTYAVRTITGTANKVSVTNGDCQAGDPVLTIPSGATLMATDGAWVAKGDLVVATGATAASRLAVGTNGQVLTADSAQATGVRWANPAGGGDALTTSPLSQFAATTSAQLAGVISDETGNGALVFATSPTLVTPNIGVATATSVNKVAITAPTTSATLTIADGATLTASASATVSGTNTGDQTNAADLTTGTLAAGRLPAFTGDVTTSAGSSVTTLANIPSAVPMAGSLLATAIAAPATPAAGKGHVYLDSTSKNVAVKDDAGAVKHCVQSRAAVASQFLTSISDDGSVTAAQPAASDVTGLAAVATSGSASDLGTGTLPIARVADGAVTLAKLASGTAGNLITYDATGTPVAVATGTAGQVLTSNGAGAAPTFQAAGGGGGANTALSNLASVGINADLATGAGTTLNLIATAPAQIATAQAGIPVHIYASPAVAGSSTAGAAAGAPLVLHAGDAARLTSGNANGGDIDLSDTGAGVGTGVPGKVVVPLGTSTRPDFTFSGAAYGAAGISATASATYFWGAATNPLAIFSNCVAIGANTLYAGSSIGSTDTSFSRAAAGTWRTAASVGGASSYLQITAGESRVTTRFDATTTTLADITGLASTLVAGRKYRFRATLFVDADATGGIKLAVGGTATATSIVYQINAIRNDTSVYAITSRQTALGGAAGSAAATAYYVEIVGTIVCNAAGTLSPQFAQNAASGTSSVLVNSTWEVTDIV